MTIRQKNKNIDFSKYKYLKPILGENECNHILQQFETKDNIFDAYDVIIIHESIYHKDKRVELFKSLETYCIKKSKILVKFSGNNSQSFSYQSLMTLSAKKLYENIEIYLSENEKNQSNILMLAYGKYWNLNPLLNTLEVLNIFIENYSQDSLLDFDDFEDDFNLLELKKILKDLEYSLLYDGVNDYKDSINITQVKHLTTNLQNIIQSKANE